MSSSLILQQFSEQLNEKKVLTHPEDFLGPNTEKLLEFWSKVEKMTENQLRIVEERYDVLYWGNHSEWCKATDLAWEVSKEVVGWKYASNAAWVAYDVTTSFSGGWATREIIGGVESPIFLKMFDERPNLFQRIIQWLKK